MLRVVYVSRPLHPAIRLIPWARNVNLSCGSAGYCHHHYVNSSEVTLERNDLLGARRETKLLVVDSRSDRPGLFQHTGLPAIDRLRGGRALGALGDGGGRFDHVLWRAARVRL